MIRAKCLSLAWLALAAAVTGAAEQPDQPPLSRRVDHTDLYHGERVADPYRWLEDTDSAATRAWITAQNAYTQRLIAGLPLREHFAARLRALIDHERFGVPRHEAGTYVYAYNRGTDEQDSLWVTTDLRQRGRLLLDPNQLRADGTVSLGDYELSPDGALLAYSLSDGGSDWKTWRIRRIASGSDLPDVLHGTKFTPLAWSRDSSGFYYSRYPQRPDGSYDDARQVAIWYRRPGTPQDADRQVFAITDHATRDPYPTVTEDGAYLVIQVRDGYQASGVYYQRLPGPGEDEPGAVVRLLDRWDALYEFIGNVGSEFFFLTTQAAPNGRVIAIDIARPQPEHWREVVPQGPAAIEAASLIAGRVVVQQIVDVRSRVAVFATDGTPLGEIALPGAGSVSGFDGPAASPVTFFSYTDFTTPRTVYRHDLATGRSEPWQAPAPGIDPAAFVTRQVWFESRDGTRVPMYIVHRGDRPPDGRRPTVLYGYGGFNVPLLPAWSASRAAWIEAGGVLAVANLRGGGEFGERWHEAGTKLLKQNVFDDFIAAAEWLIEAGYTRPEHLAIWGGSNGGLLVGAVANQRPELFAAAVPAVGVMDMLRYHTAGANARQWSSDYGLSEVPGEYRALRAYSPYHNVHPGSCYPATLVMADANDDRVAPWHSYKYAAALQHAQGCGRPVLIRVETRAGHGAGASTSKIIDEYADQWAFVAQATGLAEREGFEPPRDLHP